MVRRAYVAWNALANIFCLTWYKIVMQRSLVVYMYHHEISHLSQHTLAYNKGFVFFEKIQVTRAIIIIME